MQRFLDESRTVFSHVAMHEPTSVLIFHDESTWDIPRLIRQVKNFGVDVAQDGGVRFGGS